MTEGPERETDEDAPSVDEIEERYDFEEFGPRELAEMSAEEWETAFDPESWVTGTELIDRVEQEIRSRVAAREVFAVIEREQTEAGERLVAYADEGYAVVHEDGTVEGRGTVYRDVQPSVALCSIPEYEPDEPPEGAGLPGPEDVTAGSGRLGDLVLQFVALVQIGAGVVLFAAWIAFELSVLVPVFALGFVVVGVLLLVLVANARLSDRFRAAEFRDRLRESGVGPEERPEFVPDAPKPDDGDQGES